MRPVTKMSQPGLQSRGRCAIRVERLVEPNLDDKLDGLCSECTRIVREASTQNKQTSAAVTGKFVTGFTVRVSDFVHIAKSTVNEVAAACKRVFPGAQVRCDATDKYVLLACDFRITNPRSVAARRGLLLACMGVCTAVLANGWARYGDYLSSAVTGVDCAAPQ